MRYAQYNTRAFFVVAREGRLMQMLLKNKRNFNRDCLQQLANSASTFRRA